jgi:hypothetical protein
MSSIEEFKKKMKLEACHLIFLYESKTKREEDVIGQV